MTHKKGKIPARKFLKATNSHEWKDSFITKIDKGKPFFVMKIIEIPYRWYWKRVNFLNEELNSNSQRYYIQRVEKENEIKIKIEFSSCHFHEIIVRNWDVRKTLFLIQPIFNDIVNSFWKTRIVALFAYYLLSLFVWKINYWNFHLLSNFISIRWYCLVTVGNVILKNKVKLAI